MNSITKWAVGILSLQFGMFYPAVFAFEQNPDWS